MLRFMRLQRVGHYWATELTELKRVQLLQKEILETFSKSLPSSNNLETLVEQLADQLSGLDPQDGFKELHILLDLEL